MEQLIISYYNAILRVDPTPAQIQLWLNLIDPNNPDPGIEDLADALCFQSPETISLMKIYQVVLGRVPDSGGLDFWVQVFRDIREANPELTYEQALVATIRDWLTSEEFTDVYGTELSVEEYVSLLYINILNRPPDQAGFDFWVNEVKTGVITREELVIAFSESAEFGSMVDAEAKGILLYDAQISSDFAGDDPEHRVENDDPYGGELQNEAPLDILIGTDVDENSAEDVEVNDGQLTVVDPDAGDSHTWMLVDDADGAFKLDDPNAQSPKIIVADSSKLDHETADMLYVTVRVTDSRGETLEKTFPIDINDINEEPYNLDLSNMTIDEQDGSASNPGVAGTVVGILTADDVDDGAFGDLTFSTTDPRFDIINGNELIVADPAAFDAENGVSSVDVVVRVTDGGGLYEEKTFTIDVTPIVDEDPTDVLPDTLNVSANTPVGLSLVELVAVDPDTSPDSHTFQITNDPTDQGGGGAFAMDITGTKLVLADPTKINSTNLVDNGPVDTDGLLNGLIVFELEVLATDSNGNTYTDTIQVTVDQNGDIIPFTDTIVEVLDGTNGDDVFTANAGFGWNAPVPGFNQTANPGDIANGEGGDDLFILTKGDNNLDPPPGPPGPPPGFDGARLVTGVTLNDIESILLINEDQSQAPILGDPFGPPPFRFDLLEEVCSPCINMPPIAPIADDSLIFDASLAADLDFVSMGQSRASIGVWDLQDDYWLAAPGDENDAGPIWDIFDMTANYAWLDSDPQSKLAGEEIDELIITLDEVRLNELRITENASGNEPAFGPREEQLGTISLKASGVPSIIGSINNGWQGGPTLPNWVPFPAWGPALGTATHTLNIEVSDLTVSRPSEAMPDMAGVLAAANTAAIDFFAGQADGLGNGLLGLQNVNITAPMVNGVQQPAGDVFLVFGDAANDNDTDGDGFSLEILDGAGNGFFFFEEGGFGLGDDPDGPGGTPATAVKIDGGDGFDTLGVFPEDLDGEGEIWNIERIKILEDAGAPWDTRIDLGAVQDNALQQVVFAAGVDGDVGIFNIPTRIYDDLSGADQEWDVLCQEYGQAGVEIIFDQCCQPDGELPDDFDLFLRAENANERVDLIFKVDPDGDNQYVDNLNTDNIRTLHLSIVDCDPQTEGLFEVRHLGSQQAELRTLLLTDDDTPGTTRILHDNWKFDPLTGEVGENQFFEPNSPLRSNIDLIVGRDGVRNQEFLELVDGGQADLKFLPVLELWGSDVNPATTRPQPTGFYTDVDDIEDQLIVEANGVHADLGEGDDMITGNRAADGVTPGQLGEDYIRLNGGDDLAFGAAGNDQIEGGSGDDEIHGEEGNDMLFGDSGDDLIKGGSGDDYADGGSEDDIIFGGSGEDNLRGGTGDDAICGDDGDDCLFGEDGNDLLIGGRGDDLVDAGYSGTDVLVGDYNCEPSYVNVLLQPEEFEFGDCYRIGVDWDGDGTVEAGEYVVLQVGENDPAETFDEFLARFADALQTKAENENVDDCFTFEVIDGGIQICKIDDEPPLVSLQEQDATLSIWKFALDGEIHPSDMITLNLDGGGNEFTNIVLSNIIPALTPPVGNFYDSPGEFITLAEELAAWLTDNYNQGGAYKFESDGAGRICVIGPDTGGNPTPPSLTIADNPGVFDESPALGDKYEIDFLGFSGWETGDEIEVELDLNGGGSLFATYEIKPFDDLSDIIQGVRDAVFALGNTGTVVIDGFKVCIYAPATGVPAGEYTTAAITVNEDAAGNDDCVEVTFTEADLAIGEDIEVEIVEGGTTETYTEPFTGDLQETLQNFINKYADDLLVDFSEEVYVAIDGDDLVFKFGGTGEQGALVFSARIIGGGNASVQTVDVPGSAADALSITEEVAAADGVHNTNENIVDEGLYQSAEDKGEWEDIDLIQPVSQSEAYQDVFVAGNRQFDDATFAANAFDNDLMPRYDFSGLLDAAGLTAGANGPDGGAVGVVYVLDFNQGAGDDDLSTYNINEAYSKLENTTPDGRFHQALDAAFNGDPDRLQGDKLAFRKLDGDLDECGLASNYAEDENAAATRDDSDANAFNAFAANDSLRYYAEARTFEDALFQNHGLQWGVDVDQAIVDDAIADIADDGLANNSAGGIAEDLVKWGDASDLLGILDEAKGESWLRVYYNEAGTSATPDAVMELVGLDSKSQISFEDIVGHDCTDDCFDEAKDPVDIWANQIF